MFSNQRNVEMKVSFTIPNNSNSTHFSIFFLIQFMAVLQHDKHFIQYRTCPIIC